MKTSERSDYKSVAVNGAELAYEEQGSGEPVIFVHGGISDITIWKHQIPEFSRTYRAIAYSRRYAWPNTEIPNAVDDQMLPHVDDLAALIESLGAAPAHLVGNSWGAFICLLTALRYPTVVRTLTLEEPPVLPLFVSNKPKPQELIKLLVTRPRTGVAIIRMITRGFVPSLIALKRGDVEKSVRIFVEKVALGPASYAALSPEVKRHMMLNAKTHAAELNGAGFPKFTSDDARSINKPILLVTGQNSPRALVRMTDRLEELLPNTERVTIPNASHVMHYENPTATNKAILDFLGRQ